MPENIIGNPDQKIIDRQLHRYEQASEIYLDPESLEDSPLNDKVFVTGRIIRNNEGGVEVDVDDNCPAVALNSRVNEEYCLSLPTVQDLTTEQSQYRDQGLSLVSGGTFLWIAQNGQPPKLAALRRDAGAPVEAGSLTTPFGRGDAPTGKLAEKETREELIIIRNGEQRRILTLMVTGTTDIQRNAIIAKRIKQIQARYDQFIAEGDEEKAKYLLGLDNPDSFEFHEMTTPSFDSTLTSQIITRTNGQEIERTKALAYFDQAHNTWEMGVPTLVDIGDNIIEGITDGERWNRPASLYELDELKDDQLVPALRNYVNLHMK